MTDFEKEEFWNALTRLYDTTVELRAVAEEHTKQLQQDSEHIRALARIAEIHEHRLSHLEGEEPSV